VPALTCNDNTTSFPIRRGHRSKNTSGCQSNGSSTISTNLTFLSETNSFVIATLRAMLRPYPAERMTVHAIGQRIGNVRVDEPSLIEPIAA